MSKLTNQQIEQLITKYPEIAVKVISDYEAIKFIKKRFDQNELKNVRELQIQNKILPTFQNKK